MERHYLNNYKVNNDKWVSNELCLQEDHSCEISWPAKNYSCSFCKREFKSAQALGGHMNVHRRDRARLRLLPSWVSENSYPYPNTNPNPNANLSSSSPSLSLSSPASSSANLLPVSYKHQSLCSPSLASLHNPSTPEDIKEWAKNKVSMMRGGIIGVQEEVIGFGKQEQFEVLNSLELKMGIFKDKKDDVDLELRLGYV